MITALYAAMLAVLICVLAFQVIKARRTNLIKYADGGVEELQIARSAHSNAIEYSPIMLILLLCLEYNGGPVWLIHTAGIAFVVGRIIHARSILAGRLKGRVRGMQITFFTLFALVLLNLYYLPFAKLFAF